MTRGLHDGRDCIRTTIALKELLRRVPPDHRGPGLTVEVLDGLANVLDHDMVRAAWGELAGCVYEIALILKRHLVLRRKTE